MFTANIGRTKEIFAFLAVAEWTPTLQVSHMLVEILQKREANLNLWALHHPMCPHNQDFWRTLFRPNLDVCLGLFHPLHQIVETLDANCKLCWKGIFTCNAGKLAEEQTKKMQWTQDPPPTWRCTTKNNCRLKLIHQLPKWLSNRP
jgi:hypothetical protein